MKMRSLLALLIALTPLSAVFAQSSLTIFSEDGYKFYLVLNGQKQNSVAMTNVRIDGLTQPYYNTTIIFEDGSKGEIKKNVPVVDPNTNAFADVTYKIKTQKDGDIKMRYFSATPVAPNYVAPPDVYVMHYGQPAPPPPPPPPVQGGTTVTQTTVTQTGMGGNGGASLSVGAGIGGMNMNINISDPTMGTTSTVTRTTTTTTSTDMGYSNSGYNDAPPPPPPPARGGHGNGCRYAMDGGNFRDAKETVGKASFDETKLSTAKTILNANCMNTDQIMQVCKMFSFEASMLDFAKYAYSRCADPGNYFKVANVFSFDASRTELNNYISGQ